ncbi:Mpo1-like protein [Pseudomonas sp. UBA2684]|uniref:Mpo1-like protein n=1 Tax=Pseudomonas sp. UBA2684 TaxID=1947311 RepID=UPI000E8965AF|nr:Mpo1-like protein [Pseudomonas sp. UBA2684]HBX54653.1 terminase [Pseudomonas sp.]|tara:strand:+ start:5041 stop:5388 length:348 start_codon:yes stop_codon:yes gene_type:complete
MANPHPNLRARQRQQYRANHTHPTNLLLHLMAVPLFIVASLLLLSGLWQMSFLPLVLGIIGLVAALALQAYGHRLEAHDKRETWQRLLLEQFVTFPRFVLSGAWWRAWRERHRRK